MGTDLIIFDYRVRDDYSMIEIRRRCELTPKDVTARLTSAVNTVRAGTADLRITWGMMNALVAACAEHGLPIGPDAPVLLEELRSLCCAPAVSA